MAKSFYTKSVVKNSLMKRGLEKYFGDSQTAYSESFSGNKEEDDGKIINKENPDNDRWFIRKDKYAKYYICPKCLTEYVIKVYNYCGFCGKKLKRPRGALYEWKGKDFGVLYYRINKQLLEHVKKDDISYLALITLYELFNNLEELVNYVNEYNQKKAFGKNVSEDNFAKELKNECINNYEKYFNELSIETIKLSDLSKARMFSKTIDRNGKMEKEIKMKIMAMLTIPEDFRKEILVMLDSVKKTDMQQNVKAGK